jgi:2-dehydro-3-deoxyphosphogluconate aldolase / (4S)-4-hydroxy-2-oxoglutarate aldolase
MTKPEILARIKQEKVIALIRADGPGSLIDCARALAAGGLSVIELTMTTPGALAVLAQAAKELPHVTFGMGTVLEPATVVEAQAAGAKFIVTPAVRPAVIAVGRERGLPVLGGALTPTEVITTWEFGADIVKIFPAEFFGPAYIKSLKAPFPQINLMPTGGVTPGTVGDFLKAGAFATAAGSALVLPAALKAKDWPAITSRAQEFVTAAAQVQA